MQVQRSERIGPLVLVLRALPMLDPIVEPFEGRIPTTRHRLVVNEET